MGIFVSFLRLCKRDKCQKVRMSIEYNIAQCHVQKYAFNIGTVTSRLLFYWLYMLDSIALQCDVIPAW